MNESKATHWMLDREKYVDKKHKELEGCSDKFKIDHSVTPFFNHLSAYFPEAYQHMLKTLELE